MGLMKISVIITTYNWKEALALSLRTVLDQNFLPLEVIVADDGSREDTAELVRAMAAEAPIPIIHSWQEDKGFRLARSRNRALAKASGDYIILIDGDVLLEKHFIFDHLRVARPGFFVQGTRVLLNQRLSDEVLRAQHMRISFCTRGVENTKNCLRSDLLSRLFSFKSRRLRGVRTCNFAFWRKDAVAINGFNEAFVGWGREDSEFTARLIHHGLMRRNIKFNALAYHLYHPMNDRRNLEENDRLLEKTIREKLTWCDKGINQYLDG
jgi:glycosyltransferase involved in cell wall biosynthesis